MIVSASRRTDIPAFHSDWLFERFREGLVLVPNPRNPRQTRRVELTREAVDGIVFWTKNPQPLLERHGDELERLSMPFYFQFTVTPYGTDLEPGVPPKPAVLDTFAALSRRIGRERMVWRYDPIVLTDRYGEAWHLRQFETMAGMLAPFTDSCIVSFLDFYAKTRRNLRSIPVTEPPLAQQRALLVRLAEIAAAAGLTLATCTEPALAGTPGVTAAHCIDAERLARIAGRPFPVVRDRNQRPGCGCAVSVDIGSYGTCDHGCLYCYAAGLQKERQVSGAGTVESAGSQLLL